MAKSVRVCGKPIDVKLKKGSGWLDGTKTVRTICGRPPDHTEGSCSPGPTNTDLLALPSKWW